MIELKVGGKYNWKYQPDRLVYLGRSGIWYQFSKIGDNRAVWCEVHPEDIDCIEETKEQA
jgi:hypothetical protein